MEREGSMSKSAVNAAEGRRSRLQRDRYDRVLLVVTLLLLGVGLIMVFSASAILGGDRFGDPWHYFRRQAFSAVVGLGLMAVVARVPYRIYRYLAYPILCGTALLLVLVLIPGVGGLTGGGATRWIMLGPIRFQPSELAKISLVIYLAYSLDKKQANIKSFSIGILPHLIITGIVLALIMLEPDYGTTVTLGAILFIMMFLAGVNLKHLGLLLGTAIPIFYLLMRTAEYRMRRLTAFLDPWQDPASSGFQIIQSWIAFHSGGWLGQGLGAGQQKLFYLPEAHTDFVFSVLGEELGLVGVIVVLGLYLILILRGIRIAHHAADLFGCLLGLGIVSGLGLQTVINVGVVLGILPTKGLVLPLMSYGGTSLMVTLTGIGILLNIGASSKRLSRRVSDPSWQKVEGRQQVLRPLPGFAPVVPRARRTL